jgi:hypothetical protein
MSGAETATRLKSSLSPTAIPPLAETPFGGKHETESGRLGSASETAPLPLKQRQRICSELAEPPAAS